MEAPFPLWIGCAIGLSLVAIISAAALHAHATPSRSPPEEGIARVEAARDAAAAELLEARASATGATSSLTCAPPPLPLQPAPTCRAVAFPAPAAILAATPPERHCGRTWPIRGFSNMTGPAHTWGFSPTNCAAASYATPQPPDSPPLTSFPTLSKCLARRRVYIWGNSVSRGFAFELGPMLESRTLISRDEQKQRCSKEDANSACLSDERIGDGTTVLYQWITFMDARVFQPSPSANPLPDTFGRPENDPNQISDVCEAQAPRDCFGRILAGADVNDVLIINVGYAYGYMDPHTVPERDMLLFKIEHVRTFVALINDLFPGTVIFMAVPPTAPINVSGVWNYARLIHWNELVMQIILAETEWLVFDLWSVARDFAGSALYADAVHIPGRLTQLAWGFIDQMLCPPSSAV